VEHKSRAKSRVWTWPWQCPGESHSSSRSVRIDLGTSERRAHLNVLCKRTCQYKSRSTNDFVVQILDRSNGWTQFPFSEILKNDLVNPIPTELGVAPSWIDSGCGSDPLAFQVLSSRPSRPKGYGQACLSEFLDHRPGDTPNSVISSWNIR